MGAERHSERPMCRRGSDQARARWVDAVRMGECEEQPGKRWPAPTDGWAGGVRAQRPIDRPRDLSRNTSDAFSEDVGTTVGLPIEHQVRSRPIGLIERTLPAPMRQRRRSHEDTSPRLPRSVRACEWHMLHSSQSFIRRRRLKLAKGTHLRGRRQDRWLVPGKYSQLLGRWKRAETLEDPLDHVDLGLRERDVEPDAPSRDPMFARCLDHVAPRRPGEPRVVENDPPSARPELLVECAGELTERAPTLVAIQTKVATSDVVSGQSAFPRSGDAHEENDVRVLVRTRSLDSGPDSRAERASKGSSVVGTQTETRSPHG
jgi:hypothetical protein